MNVNSRMQSRVIYLIVLVSSLALLRCTSSKIKDEAKEPVKAEVKAESAAAGDHDLPPELRDAGSFDPATTLDAQEVQETDFYKVRKEVDDKRAHLDAEWKAQDQLDNDVRKAKEEADRRDKEQMKKEEEEREKSRLEAVKNFGANSKKRAREERIARDRAAKLPTISKEEVMWNGLED